MHKHSELVILSMILVIVFLLMWAANPAQFTKLDNFQSMAFQMPELGVLALAMMAPMLSGGINLALIATTNLTGIITVLVFHALQNQATGGLWAALVVLIATAAGIGIALIAGFINGLLIGPGGVSAILATLGMMTFIDGLNVVITRGYTIADVPPAFIFIGNGLIWGIPMPMIMFILCALVMGVILNKTALGYGIYMIGSNPIATKFAGINNNKVVIGIYLLSSFFGAIASIIMMGRFNSVKSNYGVSYLLVTILASVLGGVSPYGGFGKISGVVIALIILQMIGSGLNLMLVDPYLTIAMWGIIMILAMVANHFGRKLRMQKGKISKQ